MNRRSPARALTALLTALTLALGIGCKSTEGAGPVLPEARPDQGLVVFFRPKEFKGSALRFEIRDGSGRTVAPLANGTVIHEFVEPGPITYEVRAPSLDGKDAITLDVVAGETYYVRGTILWGWPAGRPKFERLSGQRALDALSRM